MELDEEVSVKKELVVLPLKCFRHNMNAARLCLVLDCTLDVCICEELECLAGHEHQQPKFMRKKDFDEQYSERYNSC